MQTWPVVASVAQEAPRLTGKSRHTASHLSDYGLSTGQFAVLEALFHLGILSRRASAENLVKSTVNRSIVLKNLERRGLIDRDRDPDNNQYMRVSITDAGRELIGEMFAVHVAGIVAEMASLAPAEQEELARLCRKLGLREISSIVANFLTKIGCCP